MQEPGFGRPAPVLLAEGSDHTVAGLALLGDRVAVWGNRRVRLVNHDGSRADLADLPAPLICPAVWLDGAYWWLDKAGSLIGLGLDGNLLSVGLTVPLRSDRVVLCAWGETLLAAAHGVLYDLAPRQNRCESLAQAPLPEVQCLAGLPDGRAYGVCGHGIGHVFRVDRDPARCVALGAAATAVGHHRYGFEFGPAVATAEGVIFLGEHDRGGYLWAYYPPLAANRA